jgi:hypothetical protein
MKNIIKTYNGNPYQHLVDTAKLAQKDASSKASSCTRVNPTPTTSSGRSK